MPKPTPWDTWMTVTKAVDDALGLAILADLDCGDSIIDERQQQLARTALNSCLVAQLEIASKLIATMEPPSA